MTVGRCVELVTAGFCTKRLDSRSVTALGTRRRVLGSELTKKRADLCIANLLEIAVPIADGEKGVVSFGANHLVRNGPKLLASLTGRNGNSNHDSGRLVLSNRANGCDHRGTGCKSVIDQNHDATAQADGWTLLAVGSFAAFQFELLAVRNLFDDVVGNLQLLDDVAVEDSHASGRDGAEGEFLAVGHAKFADQKDIEVYCGVQASGNLEGDRNSAPGQRQNHHGGIVDLVGDQASKGAAGL